jgi:hypothetical protein
MKMTEYFLKKSKSGLFNLYRTKDKTLLYSGITYEKAKELMDALEALIGFKKCKPL